MLTAEELMHNWCKFLDNLKYIDDSRYMALRTFYETYEDRFAFMPASSKLAYHNCMEGGYIDHVNRVLDFSFKVKKTWQDNGAIINFTDEELAFVAINHDLGKFGTIEHPYYIDQPSDWHKQRGEIYTINPETPFMKVSERSLFLLQSLGVKLTQNEYLGIRLHDGLYEEGNKGYLMSFSSDFKLKTNLPYIVHQADLMAATIEANKRTEASVEQQAKPPSEKRKLAEEFFNSRIKK